MVGNDQEYLLRQQPSGYLRVLRERKWVVVATTVIAVAVVLGISFVQTPTYEASAEVLRQTAALDQTLFGTSVFQFQDAQRQLQTGANLVKLTAVAELVKKDLASDRSVQSLLKMVTATPVVQTDVIRIAARGPDSKEAAEVANSFAVQFISHRQQANVLILAAADAKILEELGQMSPEERAGERGITLTEKHEELAILQSMQTGGFELVQEATAPLSPVSPTPIRNGGFAFLGGILAGVMLAFVLEYGDRRIKTEAVLERELGIPVLASVPRMGRRWISRSGRRADSLVGFGITQALYLEAFRTLRTNLGFYKTEKQSQTLIITSGLPQEGKTITTINLGLSLALSGARVILIEADLRRPMLHKYLHLDGNLGVSSVLSRAASFGESLQLVAVKDFVPAQKGEPGVTENDSLGKNLLCMTAGPLPPNPAELLGSSAMRDLLDSAASHADYVLIDTPPLLLVSDALTLTGSADGLIVAARMRSTTYDEARSIRTLLARSEARALGIVANGVKRGRGTYYGGRYKGYY